MRIPKKLKIAGKVYDVEITDKLYLGAATYSAEIMYADLLIRVHPAAKGKMEADFLHEVVHGIADAMGYRDHDEREIDAMAQMLHQVIQDNPEMFLPDEDEGEADEQGNDQK